MLAPCLLAGWALPPLGFTALTARAQALPTATAGVSGAVVGGAGATGGISPSGAGGASPGFRLPTVGGMLGYSLSASQSVSSGLYSQGGALSTTNLSGNVALMTSGSKHPFSMIYSGGYLFSNQGQQSPYYQNLALSQAFRVKRWSFSVSDGVSYIPETPSTGLSGIPGVGDLTTDPVEVGPTSGLGVLTQFGPRVFNSTNGSVDRAITGRLSFDGTGYVSILRYLGSSGSGASGYDSTTDGGSGGLNYRLDVRNSVGANYNYSRYSYGGVSSSFDSQGLSAVFSRLWTRRFSTVLSGGPQWVGSGSGPGGSSLSLQAAVGATYTGKQLTSALNYTRGTDNGSGAVLGAISDRLTYSVHRTFGTAWNVSGSTGYSHTKSVAALTTATFSSEGVSASGQVSRAVSRRISAFGSYTIADQTVRNTGASPNAFSGIYQVASFGVTYSPGQIHLGPR